MSATDYRIHQRAQTAQAPDPERVWEVVVTKAPADAKDLLRTRAIHGTRGRAGIEFPPAHWVAPAGGLPQVGDVALVILDEKQQPWVVSWRDRQSGGGGQTPYLIPPDETFTVEANKQVLWALTIIVEGGLVVDGALVEVD